MHRSGTSMGAEILSSAGVDLGSRLMPGKEGVNSRGFFENLDFVEFHERVLLAQGFSRFGWTSPGAVSVPEAENSAVEKLIQSNQNDNPWGWKDPRTTLFLDFWKERFPQAAFIFLYRSPWEVIDSLYRRGDEEFQKNPRLALDIWFLYNRLCLEFAQRYPQQSMIVSVEAVSAYPDLFIKRLNEQFSFNLTAPSNEVVDEKLMKKDSSRSGKPQSIKALFPQVFQLWTDLEAACEKLSPSQNSFQLATDESLFADTWLEQWMSVQQLKRELRTTNDTLYSVRSDLYHANEKISFYERSRLWKLRNALRSSRAHATADSAQDPG